MSEPLTQLEQQVYHFMIDFLAENTYQPSVREIARKFQIKSTKTVSDLLHSLEGKGYIKRDESRSRGVRLIGFAGAGATQPVPCYGSLGALSPGVREHSLQTFITIDRRFIPGPDVYCATASGGGATSRAILDGDYLMISPSTAPKPGDLAAVRIGNEITLKVFGQRDATTVLTPADGGAAVELRPGDDFAVLGTVCGVFRPYAEQTPAPVVAPADNSPVS